MSDRLLTPTEVARRLEVRPETVWRWIKKGAVAYEEIGPYRRKRIRESVAASLNVSRGSALDAIHRHP